MNVVGRNQEEIVARVLLVVQASEQEDTGHLEVGLAVLDHGVGFRVYYR